MAAPGTIIESRERLLVATGVDAIEIARVQAAGKKRMPVAEWLRGVALPGSARFT